MELSEFAKHICLACLMESDTKLKPLFEDDSEDLVTKIEECGGIKITQDDECPNQICHNCYAFLNIAHRFRTTCQRSQEELRRRYQEKVRIDVKKEDVEGFESVLLTHIDCEYLEDQFVKVEDLNKHSTHEDILEIAIDLERQPEKAITQNNQLKKRTRRSKEQNKIIEESKICESFAERSRKRKTQKQETKLEDNTTIPMEQSDDDSSQLSKNINSKMQKDSLICHQCGNKYANRQHLHAHLKQHQSVMERENVCEICAKRFTTARHLQIHMNTHTGNRPFKCKYCSSSFGDPSSRIKHEHAHDNIRPYKCDVCEKAFTYSFALTNHRRIHTGEKPYSCSFCKKCFTQQHHKKTHELTHTKQLNNK